MSDTAIDKTEVKSYFGPIINKVITRTLETSAGVVEQLADLEPATPCGIHAKNRMKEAAAMIRRIAHRAL